MTNLWTTLFGKWVEAAATRWIAIVAACLLVCLVPFWMAYPDIPEEEPRVGISVIGDGWSKFDDIVFDGLLIIKTTNVSFTHCKFSPVRLSWNERVRTPERLGFQIAEDGYWFPRHLYGLNHFEGLVFTNTIFIGDTTSNEKE